MSDDTTTESAIKAAGADKAPRVTPADLEAEIKSEHYFTAKEGQQGAVQCFTGIVPEALGLLTFCVLVLKNGFTVTGQSSVVSPANFDAEIGRKVARQNAVNQLWPLLGFRLRDKLSA